MRLGRVVVEEAAQAVLHPDDLKQALDDHAAGYWGECYGLDRYENEQALKTGGSVLSVFHDRDGHRFLVCTNGARSVTKVELFEEED